MNCVSYNYKGSIWWERLESNAQKHWIVEMLTRVQFCTVFIHVVHLNGSSAPVHWTQVVPLFGQQKIIIQFVAINDLWQLVLLDIFFIFLFIVFLIFHLY
jgi:hypothetical protein